MKLTVISRKYLYQYCTKKFFVFKDLQPIHPDSFHNNFIPKNIQFELICEEKSMKEKKTQYIPGKEKTPKLK